MNANIDSGRLNRLRTARGVTQSELAMQLKMPLSLFNRIENGRHPVDNETFLRIAHSLECKPDVLSRPVPDTLHTRPWLRAYADAPKKIVDEYISNTLLALESFDELGLRRIPERLPLFDGDPNNEEDIDDFALEVRQASDIQATSEVRNVTRAAERLGCIVLPLDSELGKHLGMSMLVDGIPVLRASRPTKDGGVPGDRQRFTLAHELGHVTMHSTYPPPDTAEQAKVIEKQAHRFAGAFLLPGDAFLDDLDAEGGRVTLMTLSKLKARWGVAIKAMVVRLQNLHRIDSDQARSLYKQISARDWNKQEPVAVGNERAVWLAKALERRFPNSGDAIGAAVDQIGLSRTYFEGWASWQPPAQDDAKVLDFARRHRSTAVGPPAKSGATRSGI